MKILLAGDSFAANWNDIATNAWWQLVAQENVVHNVAQPGCGEYKILQQLLNCDLKKYDLIVVCHTSPYRIHTLLNPFHNTGFHKNSDLIYTDISCAEESDKKNHIIYFFENIFDLDYARCIHNLVKKEITQVLASYNNLHISFFENFKNEYTNCQEINLYHVWKKHPGHINHLSPAGNQQAYVEIKKRIVL
jgi:hypothetical protein